MIRCVLFDLDGTLVHFEYDDFLDEYFKAITKAIGKIIEPEHFAEALMATTEVMIGNTDSSRKISEVFLDDFFQRVDVSEDILMPAFEDFYRNEFTELRDTLGIKPHPKAREMIEFLINEGYDVIIATNSVFPIEAIEERMRWGDILGFPYKLITCYDTMHFCKPNPKYYEEILKITQYKPEECLMVGNNVDEDIIAGILGMKTYLVDDFLLDSETNNYKPDFRNDFNGLIEFVLAGNIQTL
ncbi:MAG: HAD family hydrolase [Firmicutes bacterium]|nr:HAD family hydrolase [Bacillota bacterium]